MPHTVSNIFRLSGVREPRYRQPPIFLNLFFYFARRLLLLSNTHLLYICLKRTVKICVNEPQYMKHLNWLPFMYKVGRGTQYISVGRDVPICIVQSNREGAQWLSGRVLDSRPKGRGFEPHRRHCVVVLEQDTFILA